MPQLATVGDIRRLIADMPDETPVLPDWAFGPPDDSAPAVELAGMTVGFRDGERHLSMLVDLVWLEDIDSEEYELEAEPVG